MIFWEYASPMPGNSLNWSLVAVLMSSFSVAGFAAAELLGAAGLAWPTARPLTRERAKHNTAICAISFLSANFIPISFARAITRKCRAGGWYTRRDRWPACRLRFDW